MVRFDDPATAECAPQGQTFEHPVDDLTPAQVEAIMRSIDEALIDAQRLCGLPQGLHLALID
jgi:phage gp29-like protein